MPVSVLSLILTLLGCFGSSDDGVQPPPDLPSHTLAFGGDVTLGRNLNLFLHTGDTERMLGDLPWLSAADITLVNAEGVIATGGRFYDKGESRPYTYRVHPKALDMLHEAGVDVLAVGNNHANDYGPSALTEMLDRVLAKGMTYTGGGYDAQDARRPAYVAVGDTVVAFVGADLTYGQPHEATGQLAGTLWLPGMQPKKQDRVVSVLTKVLAEARKHADVVLFTPHWGDNFETAPSEHTRRLARRLIDAGYDGILGHSSHLLQGIELIDGKPVIYDAGNLLSDYLPSAEHARTGVFVLTFTKAGVTGIVVHPAFQLAGRTGPVSERSREASLRTIIERSRALGTELVDAGTHVELVLDPGKMHPRPSQGPPPRRRAPDAIREAAHPVFVDALPDSATKAEVVWENGVRLLGYEVLMDELRIPKAGNVVTLYMQSTKDLGAGVMIGLEADYEHGHVDSQDHMPGDWLIPSQDWPQDKILRDETLVRLTGKPEGKVTMSISLKRGHIDFAIEESSLPTKGNRVIIAITPYTKEAERLWTRWPRP